MASTNKARNTKIGTKSQSTSKVAAQGSGKSSTTGIKITERTNTPIDTNTNQHQDGTQETEIILEQIDIEQNTPSHPVQLGKIFTQINFRNYTEITKVGKFRFKIKLQTTCDFEKLKKTKLDDHNLKVYQPKIANQIICFIKGVPKSFTEREIEENLEIDYEVIKIERIKRLASNEQLIDTPNIKITVKGTKIPENVKIYGCFFRVELYVFPIRQCQNCWRYGHKATFCTSRKKCPKCGDKHTQSECTEPPKCINCNLNHEANAKDCPERKRRQMILQEMKKKRVTYAEAASNYPKITNRYDLLEDTEAFPMYTDGEDRAEIGRSMGTNRRTNRVQQSKASSYSTDFEGFPSEQSPSHTRRHSEESRGCQCIVNLLKTTEFERFINTLKMELLAEIRAKSWINPLMELQLKISTRAQKATTETERDQLLVAIGQDIQSIIESASQEGGRCRTRSYSHSGV